MKAVRVRCFLHKKITFGAKSLIFFRGTEVKSMICRSALKWSLLVSGIVKVIPLRSMLLDVSFARADGCNKDRDGSVVINKQNPCQKRPVIESGNGRRVASCQG